MPRYCAFLRAINVGRRRVKMDRLRRLFQEMGCTGVETLLASGNVVFSAPNPQGLEERIEEALHGALGYEVTTFVRTLAEVAQIARYPPFPPSQLKTPDSRLYIGFLTAAPEEQARQALLACSTETDQFHIHERQVYWLCHTRMSESVFSGAQLERTLGMPTTMRNAKTIRRIAKKYPPQTP